VAQSKCTLYSHWGLSAQNSIARACKVAGIAATQKHTLHLPKATTTLVQMDFTQINFNRHAKDYSRKSLTIYQYL
jgi:hypothetical protein